MPQRRYWAPQENLWGEEEDPAETMAELTRINEQERANTARDMLNALNGPQRSPIATGFGLAPNNSVYQRGGLPDAIREQQRRQNLLLGSAQAIAMLTGKAEGKTENRLPNTVNNITPGEQLSGSEGDPGAAERMMRRQIARGQIAEPAPTPTYDDYHDRFQPSESPPIENWWEKEVNTRADRVQAENNKYWENKAYAERGGKPPQSYLDEALVREAEYQRNRETNQQAIDEEERRRRLRRGY
jgi:hypothetical protein